MTQGGFDLGPRRRPRRMSLTPMIDVVFLLLIFFMLASRFGMDVALPIAGGAEGQATEWQGAPRLVDVTPDAILLNGTDVLPSATIGELNRIRPEAIVIVGGTGVVSSAVEQQLANYSAP